MPTGLTYPIYDNTPGYTFEDFVWSCARQFGALIHMRDDNQGAAIRKLEPNSYYNENLKEAKKRLADLENMTLKQAEKRANAEYLEAFAALRKREAECAERKARFNAYLIEVQAWQPPTKDHENLKTFMIDQLVQSIDYDCNPHSETLKRRTAEEWLNESKKDALRDIKYYEKQLAEEQKRIAKVNKWIDELAKSVPLPKKLKG